MTKLIRMLCAVALIGLAGGCEKSSKSSPGFPSDTRWIYGTDISSWPVTIKLSFDRIENIRHNYYEVFVDYDRLQQLPAWYVPDDPNNSHNVNGSIWLIREYENQWYAGTIDYLKVGQKSKRFAASPGLRFMPNSGDRVGFMVSTVNRDYNGTLVHGDPNSPYRERSNIAWMTWP